MVFRAISYFLYVLDGTEPLIVQGTHPGCYLLLYLLWHADSELPSWRERLPILPRCTGRPKDPRHTLSLRILKLGQPLHWSDDSDSPHLDRSVTGWHFISVPTATGFVRDSLFVGVMIQIHSTSIEMSLVGIFSLSQRTNQLAHRRQRIMATCGQNRSSHLRLLRRNRRVMITRGQSRASHLRLSHSQLAVLPSLAKAVLLY